MCGIIGNFSFQKETLLTEDIFRRLNQTQQHRGPDDGAVYFKNDISLGSRRLAVIDINGGYQPMISRDGRYVIVFNGEIYNYQELRKELLESRAIVFRTRK